jgi:hypothetical protein
MSAKSCFWGHMHLIVGFQPTTWVGGSTCPKSQMFDHVTKCSDDDGWPTGSCYRWTDWCTLKSEMQKHPFLDVGASHMEVVSCCYMSKHDDNTMCWTKLFCVLRLIGLADTIRIVDVNYLRCHGSTHMAIKTSLKTHSTPVIALPTVSP